MKLTAPCCSRFEDLLATNPGLAREWAALPRRNLARGGRLFDAGDSVSSVWRIEAGLIRLFYLSSDGNERTRSFHSEGDWLGAGVPLAATASAFAAESLEPAVVVELPITRLQRLQAEHPAVREEILETLGHVFACSEHREASLLGGPAQRYQAFLADRPDLADRVALRYVASYLGITNVALSRIRRRLGLLRR